LADAVDDSVEERVLSTNTIVSKVGQPRGRTAGERAQAFRGNDATVTVAEGNDAAVRAATTADVVAPAPAAETALHIDAKQSATGSRTRALDDTAETGRARAPEQAAPPSAVRVGSRASLPAPRPGVRGRTVAFAAGVGVLCAAVAIAALEVGRPSRSSVQVTVTSTTPGAVAAVAGVDKALPAVFEALPGDTFDVVVRAPGYAEGSRRVQVSKSDPQDVLLDVSLDVLRVPIVVRVTPPTATVVARDAPWEPTATYAVGDIVMVQATAPGFTAARREVLITAGAPVVVELTLRAEAPVDAGVAAVVDTADAGTARPKDRMVRPQAKTGTLKLVTKPVIAQVTIDGRDYEEPTPLTVELKPGPHAVVLTPAGGGPKRTLRVTIKGGEVVEKVVRF
jgi:hypothetical protein